MASTNAYTSGTPPFLPGGAISASALERLREADQRALPQRTVGAFVSQRPRGTLVITHKNWDSVRNRFGYQ